VWSNNVSEHVFLIRGILEEGGKGVLIVYFILYNSEVIVGAKELFGG